MSKVKESAWSTLRYVATWGWNDEIKKMSWMVYDQTSDEYVIYGFRTRKSAREYIVNILSEVPQ